MNCCYNGFNIKFFIQKHIYACFDSLPSFWATASQNCIWCKLIISKWDPYAFNIFINLISEFPIVTEHFFYFKIWWSCDWKSFAPINWGFPKIKKVTHLIIHLEACLLNETFLLNLFFEVSLYFASKAPLFFDYFLLPFWYSYQLLHRHYYG